MATEGAGREEKNRAEKARKIVKLVQLDVAKVVWERIPGRLPW